MSDLLICEGMYGDKEKKAKAVENKHMMFLEAAQTAKEAEVNELWLTHYAHRYCIRKITCGKYARSFQMRGRQRWNELYLGI